MDRTDWLAERFEANRTHLRAVAYRMLGSLSEAEDVVQDAWFRLSRSDTSEVDNLDGWLTTVVARLSLDALRARKTRREDSLEAHVPDPIIDREDAVDPEHAALLADSVGLALLVVLDMLDPAERLAFVLHDMFGVAFDEIAPMVDRSPDAARQLASRARRRVQGAAKAPDLDVRRQREVVDAFFAAARDGDFEALVSVLDPDVVLRADNGPGSPLSVVHRGAQTIASGALLRFAGERRIARPARVNGAAGVVITVEGQPVSVIAFSVIDGKIVQIDVLADPERLAQLDLGNVTQR
jgi:RNA polymerase sigma factor (sigma-70 family)